MKPVIRVNQGDVVSFRVEHVVNGTDIGRELAGRVMRAGRVSIIRTFPQRPGDVISSGRKGRVLVTAVSERMRGGAVYAVPNDAITSVVSRKNGNGNANRKAAA